MVHIYFDQLDFDDIRRYATAANWVPNGFANGKIKWLPLRNERAFVEPDGFNSLAEDFANNVEYLAFDPAKLKKLTPSLYSWLVAFLGDKLRPGGACGPQKK